MNASDRHGRGVQRRRPHPAVADGRPAAHRSV